MIFDYKCTHFRFRDKWDSCYVTRKTKTVITQLLRPALWRHLLGVMIKKKKVVKSQHRLESLIRFMGSLSVSLSDLNDHPNMIPVNGFRPSLELFEQTSLLPTTWKLHFNFTFKCDCQMNHISATLLQFRCEDMLEETWGNNINNSN